MSFLYPEEVYFLKGLYRYDGVVPKRQGYGYIEGRGHVNFAVSFKQPTTSIPRGLQDAWTHALNAYEPLQEAPIDRQGLQEWGLRAGCVLGAFFYNLRNYYDRYEDRSSVAVTDLIVPVLWLGKDLSWVMAHLGFVSLTKDRVTDLYAFGSMEGTVIDYLQQLVLPLSRNDFRIVKTFQTFQDQSAFLFGFVTGVKVTCGSLLDKSCKEDLDRIRFLFEHEDLAMTRSVVTSAPSRSEFWIDIENATHKDSWETWDLPV